MHHSRSRDESVSKTFKRLCTESGATAPKNTGARPPTLWSLSLSSALSAIATEDVDRLADALIADPPLRAALQERLLRRARHIGDLADDDLMEVVISRCDLNNSTLQSRATLRVKTLPFRVRAAAKLFFREACAAPRDAPPSADVCHFADDGRLEFDISEVDFFEREEGVKTEWTNKYLEVIGGVVRDIGVPARESVGIAPMAMERYVSLKRYFPHLQRDTLEYDAHELVINDRPWALGYEVDDDFSTYFFDDGDPKVSEHVGKQAEDRDAVWVRKPRIRFVVTQRCECKDEGPVDSEADSGDEEGSEGSEQSE